ncbi:hypothetical protein [Actinoplanes sp. NPDC051494]|uniref:hypothetical protein n=1 Tax=Actinoplanes sp. NPDC051494 TaxID=3363907 RepID=UPI00379FA2B2
MEAYRVGRAPSSSLWASRPPMACVTRLVSVLFATTQGIATVMDGAMVPPDLLDGLVETAVDQFVRGSRAGWLRSA